jgi:hypothetical protein
MSKTTNTAGSDAGAAALAGTPCAADYPDKQPKDVCTDATGTVTLQGLTVSLSR